MIEAHLDMANKCKAVNLLEQHDFHLQQVLQWNGPRRRPSKTWVCQSRTEWRREDANATARLHSTRRTLAYGSKVAVIEANEQIEDEEIEWRKILRWEGAILKNRSTAPDAIKSMREIKDYRATKTLAERLNEPQLPREMKIMYLEILSEIGRRSRSSNAQMYYRI